MPIRKYAYRDPAEDEYIFNCLKNKFPEWAKKGLTPEDYRIFQSDTTIRRFVDSAPHDRRDLLLSKGNIFMIKLYVDFNEEKPGDLLNFDKLHKQFKKTKNRQEVIEEIQKKNAFATSSREIANVAYLIAQNCHSPYYYINRDYQKVYDAVESVRLKNLKGFNEDKLVAKIKLADRSRDRLCALVLSVFNMDNYVKIIMKLDSLDINILLLLFMYRDRYVEKKAVFKNIEYVEGSISNSLGKLVTETYIVNGGGERRTARYTIAERGVEAICKLLEMLASQAVNL